MTQAIAVQRQAQSRFRHAVFGQHRAQVGMVVLNPDQRHFPLLGQVFGQHAGVGAGFQVASHCLRSDAGEVEQVVGRLLQRLAGQRVVERADVLRHEGVLAAQHGGGGLHIGAQRQYRRAVQRQRHRVRHKAASAAEQQRPPPLQRYHAIVATSDDGAVMQQEDVGYLVQPFAGLLVAGDDGLAGQVGAAHHP